MHDDAPSDRRSFIAKSGGALFALAGAPAIFTRRSGYDLVIRGGTLFDGTGSEGRDLDLAISGARIAEIAPRIAKRAVKRSTRGGSPWRRASSISTRMEMETSQKTLVPSP